MKPCASFFQNGDCEYFPCHTMPDTANFNCLFCYCPLYPMADCGGNYTIGNNGVKDCSACILPHKAENYTYVIEKLGRK